jgi:hypothetical protein
VKNPISDGFELGG